MKKNILLIGVVLLALSATQQTFSRVSIGFGIGSGSYYDPYYHHYYPYHRYHYGPSFGLGFSVGPRRYYDDDYYSRRSYRVCTLEDRLDDLKDDIDDAQKRGDTKTARRIRREMSDVRSELNRLKDRGYYCSR